MASRNLLFRVLYRLRFTPWDGHPLAQRRFDHDWELLSSAVETTAAGDASPLRHYLLARRG